MNNLYWKLAVSVLWALLDNKREDLMILLNHRDYNMLKEYVGSEARNYKFFDIRVVEIYANDKPKVVRIT